MATNDSTRDELIQTAVQAYVYGYPLVYGMREMQAFVEGKPGKWPMSAPYNEFGHSRELAGPDFAFVTPNNDTPYSVALYDLSQGPLVLHVPDTADRYYVLQFVDAWTNNFAYVGRRATGTAHAQFLLVPAGYDGVIPDGMRVIHSPSTVFVIVGRIQADGPQDLPAVHALQDPFTLTRYSADAPAPVTGLPKPDPRVPQELQWWESLRVLLAAFPPPEADAAFMRACAQFGLLDAHSPYDDLDPSRAALLIEAQRAGDARIEASMKSTPSTPTGWQSLLHLFDYNLDFFEIGTIGTAQWMIPDRSVA